MTIVSNWKLTLGAGVILDFGWELAEELKFPQSNGLEVVRTPDSAWSLLLDTGNSAVTIRVGVLTSHADDRTARAACLDQLVGRAAETIAPLRIDVKGYTDRHWTFAQCRAREFEPAVVPHQTKAKVLRTFNLICAGLTRTGP